MSICGIYKIQSLIKPKRCYIGSSIDITDRWQRHIFDLNHHKHHSVKLQRHYDKYGKNDLVFSILIGCDKDDLIVTEQYFLDVYNPYFNSSLRAYSCKGVKHSEQARKNMSEGQKRRGKHPEEHNRKMSEAMKGKYKGKKHSLQSRKNMSDAHKGKMVGHPVSQETRDKIGKAHLGIKRTEEQKQRMKEAQQARYLREKLEKVNSN